MKVAIIDYGAGNVRSVLFALERLGVEAVLTDNYQTIGSADRIIFPGQGEARSAMRHLQARGLDKLIPQLKQPFLGICIGMQLLCQHSEENDTKCLGIIPQKVRRFKGDDLKVPHVGWNTAAARNANVPIWHEDSKYYYFVHSYFVEKGDFTTLSCDYGNGFSAGLQKDNFYAVQFHPEKSGRAGELLLNQFLKI
jgi:imidazole glycerol-phosphate synthase subunit HisH